MEEYGRRVVAKVGEIREELLRLALTDKEVVKEVDEIKKNGGCVACHSENAENNIDNNKTSVSISNEKQNNNEQQLTTVNQVSQPNEETNENNVTASNQNNEQLENNNNSSNQVITNITNQDNTNIDKDTLISQLKAEITELKKKS